LFYQRLDFEDYYSALVVRGIMAGLVPS